MTCSCCKRDDLTLDDFHRDRGVTHSHCKKCRRLAYLRKRYQATCGICGDPMPDRGDVACRSCRAQQGLRHCCRCKLVLPVAEFFYGREPYCKDCRSRRG